MVVVANALMYGLTAADLSRTHCLPSPVWQAAAACESSLVGDCCV